MLPDLEEAEEVVQNVFFKIWERHSELQIDLSIKAYLYRAVHNACLNNIKHQKVKQEHRNHVMATETEGIEETVIEQQELKAEITAAVNALPEKCSEVFSLVKLDGLKYKEVAALLGISEKTVENQMGKALKFLRGKLAHLVSIILPLILFFLKDIGGK